MPPPNNLDGGDPHDDEGCRDCSKPDPSIIPPRTCRIPPVADDESRMQKE